MSISGRRSEARASGGLPRGSRKRRAAQSHGYGSWRKGARYGDAEITFTKARCLPRKAAPMVSMFALFRLIRIYSRRTSCGSLPGRRACFVLSTLGNLAERRADRWDGEATHHFLKLEQNITCSISSIAYNCAMDVSVKQLEEAVAVRKQIDQLRSRLDKSLRRLKCSEQCCQLRAGQHRRAFA